MGKGRYCEMVERAKIKENQTYCYQDQKADQIKISSPNKALSMSEGKQKHYQALWKSR